MATLLSYRYTERWQDWTLVYKALQHSWTNNLRTSNILSFSSSLPRFQDPSHSTPGSFMLFCDEDMLSLSTLTVLMLSKQLLPVQEISTAYILPASLCYHFPWYTLSLFFLKEWKVKYTYLLFPNENYCECWWVYISTKASCFLKSKSDIAYPHVIYIIVQK